MTKKLIADINFIAGLAADMCGGLHPDVMDESRERVRATAEQLRRLVRQAARQPDSAPSSDDSEPVIKLLRATWGETLQRAKAKWTEELIQAIRSFAPTQQAALVQAVRSFPTAPVAPRTVRAPGGCASIRDGRPCTHPVKTTHRGRRLCAFHAHHAKRALRKAAAKRKRDAKGRLMGASGAEEVKDV